MKYPHLITFDDMREAGVFDYPQEWRRSLSARLKRPKERELLFDWATEEDPPRSESPSVEEDDPTPLDEDGDDYDEDDGDGDDLD